MICTRWVTVGMLAAGLAVSSQASRADEPAPAKEDAPAAAPAEAPKPAANPEAKEKPKDPFFGDHFAMYLETRGGPATIDRIQNPVTAGVQLSSVNEIELKDNKAGQFTIGWTLPRGRGQYLLIFNGVSDGNYELDATGSQLSYSTTEPARPLSFVVPWWHVTVKDGVLHTTQTPPVWNATTDDTNGNGVPDFDEMLYPATEVDLTAQVPKDLGNTIQTWDLAYRREFGGQKIRARWKAGLRYLRVEGTIVTPSWLKGTPDPADFGYSDGTLNNFLLIDQTTKGYGPIGSGEIQFHFFRQRFTLYGEVEAAFLVQSLRADSGAFTYFAPDTTAGTGNHLFPGQGRVSRDVNKNAWNTTIELGMRVKLLEGFHAILDWNKSGYLDSILIPNDLAIPANSAESQFGTSGRFVSRDYLVTTIQFGLSFQF
jgi:hypothetical protein